MEQQPVLVHNQKGLLGDINIYKRIVDSKEYISYKENTGYYHSDICISNPLVGQAPLSMTVLALLFPVKKVLILGAGLFANSIQMSLLLNNDVQITAVDLEESLYDLGKKFLHIDEYKNINFVAMDAKQFILQNTEKFDYIIVDLFQDSSMPVDYLTDEFYAQIYKSLNEEGVLVINSNMPELKFISKNNQRTNPVTVLQSTLFHNGFETIYGNDTFNLGIIYAFKGKINRSFKELLLNGYKDYSLNIHVRVALAAIYLMAYQYDNNCSVDVFSESDKSHYNKIFKSFLIKSIMESDKRQHLKIENVYDEFSELTYEYFLKEIQKGKGGYDINDINYYNKVMNIIKENQSLIEPNKMMRYVKFGLQLDSLLSEDLQEVSFGKYFLAINRVRKNKAEEAEKYFDLIFQNLK